MPHQHAHCHSLWLARMRCRPGTQALAAGCIHQLQPHEILGAAKLTEQAYTVGQGSIADAIGQTHVLHLHRTPLSLGEQLQVAAQVYLYISYIYTGMQRTEAASGMVVGKQVGLRKQLQEAAHSTG